MLFVVLAVSSAMVVLTIAIHMAGLVGLMAFMRARVDRFQPHRNFWRQSLFILVVVLGLFMLHTIQIWCYAVLYLALGEFQDFETALYFSTVSFTTVGYGDVYQTSDWRLISAIESANGFILIGWSTAFLVSVISRLRDAEWTWLDRREDRGAQGRPER